MAGSPIEAARNVTRLDQITAQATEIRLFVARGIISDMVRELTKVVANRMVTGPEEIKLYDFFLQRLLEYVKAISTGKDAIAYMSPIEQQQEVDRQSRGKTEMLLQQVEAEILEDNVGTAPGA